MNTANIGIVLFLLTVFTVYTGANIYIAKKLLFLCEACFKVNIVVFVVVYTLIALTALLNYMPFPSTIRWALRLAGSCWMGFLFYLLLLFAVTDMLILIVRALKAIPVPVFKNIRFYTGLTVIALSAVLTVYGVINANIIKVTKYDVKLHGKLLADGAMNIVLVSDLHLGAALSEGRLTKIVEKINGQNPDLICIAGDIFDGDYYAISNPDKASTLLKNLKAKYGVYACLGNHDAGKTAGEMETFLEESNIKPLKDGFDIVGEQLILIGRLDPRPIGGFKGMRRANLSKIMSQVVSQLPAAGPRTDEEQTKQPLPVQSMPVIVIDHNPQSIPEYAGATDLVLSGHTHKGQLFPANLVTKAMFVSDYGYYRQASDKTGFIVTSGAGTWGPPMRIATHSEIVNIYLH
ncbi:MAG: metallophosphoesterase [Chitinispirillales bacterium]|jgi:predicted MPP superfamily phosphohydrolase|nr:metallophosphoesterase [Chitinispirillales bacterium]